MYNVLESDPELGLVFPDYYYVDIDGNRTGEERRHNLDKEVSCTTSRRTARVR